MKTCLFSHSLVDGVDRTGESRLARTNRWINAYALRLQDLNASKIFLVDDASSIVNLSQLGGNIFTPNFRLFRKSTSRPYLNIIRFPNKIPKTDDLDYPYYWRGIRFIPKIMQKYGFQKVINNETDLFVLSPALIRYLSGLKKGWTAFWCPTHQFPETALNVICTDAIPLLEQFNRYTYKQLASVCAEKALPFTKVCKKFTGDRYGEKSLAQTPDMDFYAQASPLMPLKYDNKESI
ncbi:MAG: hypothetical protein KGP28_12090 [Bdellovibrionales bacterium]|nr:hypothetical protein [Bdellovibrionales bacterium]